MTNNVAPVREEDGTYQTRRIKIELSEVIDSDLEGFLDLISERAFGSLLLTDIHFSVVGAEDGDILLDVRGDVSQILVEQEDANKENKG